MYHEITAINLLEVVLYNKNACLSAGDALIDLVDYCACKMTHFASMYVSLILIQLTVKVNIVCRPDKTWPVANTTELLQATDKQVPCIHVFMINLMDILRD
jgi:hypothetical protein